MMIRFQTLFELQLAPLHHGAATELLLLSDASQAVGLEKVFPNELQDETLFPDVRLTEVVRSSKRIVAGRCRLTVSKPVLKAPLVSALETKLR